MNTDRIATLDARLIAAAKGIHILGSIAWPEQTYHAFMSHWKSKQPKLPMVEYAKPDLSEIRAELKNICHDASKEQDPFHRFLADTSNKYIKATELLEAVGRPEFCAYSIELYGSSKGKMPGSHLTHFDAASKIIETNRLMIRQLSNSESDYCITPQAAADFLSREVTVVLGSEAPRIAIDPSLSSIAAASAKRIRLRGSTCFSQLELDQLLNHEAYVHALTALNGQSQPLLKSLGLSSPRTTRTQEGLATFAEIITDTLDLHRLNRIAMRVIAIQMGMDGADFIQVFKFFLENGQTEHESFFSAARIFRGGDVRGKNVFTKDSVYIQGLLFVHTFFLKSVQQGNFDYLDCLFAGRLTLSDVISLTPHLHKEIAPPRFSPPWLSNRNTFAAYLSYSSLQSLIPIENVELSALAAMAG